MQLDSNNLENILFAYIDQMKVLISPEIWGNALLECSKNEALVLLLLYRESDVNMTQIAEYLTVPLNTATGIVSRMEKKEMVLRERSEQDKRVVTIVLTDSGKKQMQDILKQLIHYGQRIIESLSMQEIELAGRILDKITYILQEERFMEVKPTNPTVKRIRIE